MTSCPTDRDHPSLVDYPRDHNCSNPGPIGREESRTMSEGTMAKIRQSTQTSLCHVIRYRTEAVLHAGRCRRRSRSGYGPARRIPVHARRAAHDVSRPLLDDAPVCGLRQRGGIESALSLPARSGADGSIGRVRSAHADRLRRRRSDGRRRSGQGRREHLVAARHGDCCSIRFR